MINPFTNLGGEAIQLLTTALGRLLLGVDESNPQTRCPGISNLRGLPLSVCEALVTGDEVGRLGNRGGYNIWPLLAGPHCRGQAHDGRLGLGDDTVPVMPDERIAAGPSNVLGLPVTMAQYTPAPVSRSVVLSRDEQRHQPTQARRRD